MLWYTLKKRQFESKWKYDVKTKVSDSKKLLSPWVREDKTVNGINCRWLAAASVVQFDNFLATSHFRQHALFNTGKKMNSHSEKYMSSRCIFWRLKVSMTRIQYVHNTARVIGYEMRRKSKFFCFHKTATVPFFVMSQISSIP